MGKPSLLCYLTRSPLLPPDGRAGGGRTKGQTADRCAQPATCTRARSPTPFGPRHQSKTGRLTWQSRAGPRGVPGPPGSGERFCKRQPRCFSEPERGAPPSAPGALLTPSASSVASTQARSPHPQAWESIRKLKRKPIIGNLTGLQVRMELFTPGVPR